MIIAALIINILILFPVCLGLHFRLHRFDRVFGEDNTARQILTSIYLAILTLSIAILLNPQTRITFAIPLLSLQVIYKIISVILIRDKKTPVLWFNLAVAIFHSVAIYVNIHTA
jgi:hypothetical protein